MDRSRARAGVHALGQVIHLISLKLEGRRARFALDTQTPEDIDFILVEQVADDFPHAEAQLKTYEFIVDYGRPKSPMMRHYATHYPYPLDVERCK